MPRPLNDPEGGPGVLLTARVPGAMKDRVRALAAKLQKPYGRVVQEAIEAGLPHVDGTEKRSVPKPAKGEGSEIRSETSAEAVERAYDEVEPRAHVLVKGSVGIDPVRCTVCQQFGGRRYVEGLLCVPQEGGEARG